METHFAITKFIAILPHISPYYITFFPNLSLARKQNGAFRNCGMLRFLLIKLYNASVDRSEYLIYVLLKVSAYTNTS